MAIICPTVTAENVRGYQQQLGRLEDFAQRIHLDFMDGLFTRNRSVSLEDAMPPDVESVQIDLHLMFMRPDLYFEQVMRFKPSLVIVQAEAKGDFSKLADKLHGLGVKVGVALLQDTPVSSIAPAINDVDHVLIFSGHLGHFGGKADLALLSKATTLKGLKPELEIAWDGGINEQNARALVGGGIDVLNVGGYIQHANDPSAAYAKLKQVIGN